MSELTDCRKPFAQALQELAESDPRIIAVTNDSVGSSNLVAFRSRFPERLIDVGIAEQNLVGVGVGLANSGLLPFVCAATCFLTGRALEQIKIDVGYGQANVKLCGTTSGLAYGPLGPTHHSLEDLAWTRVIPNLVVVVPADDLETAQAVRAAAEHVGPVFLRISRTPVPRVHPKGYQFRVGRAVLLRKGSDITLIATGIMVCRALQAAELLEKRGISARVLNVSTIKPLDEESILEAAQTTRGIVTVEEHSIYGGLGSAVAELVATHHPVPMRILGIPGVFPPTGGTAWLLEHFALTPAGIAEAAEDLLSKRLVYAEKAHPGSGPGNHEL